MSSTADLLILEAEGQLLGSPQDALDLISTGKTLIAIPKQRMDPAFFRLSTRMAGEFLHKMVTYRRTVAFIGDFSAEISQSGAFRDFVIESNRGKDFFFLPNLAALTERLAR